MGSRDSEKSGGSPKSRPAPSEAHAEAGLQLCPSTGTGASGVPARQGLRGRRVQTLRFPAEPQTPRGIPKAVPGFPRLEGGRAVSEAHTQGDPWAAAGPRREPPAPSQSSWNPGRREQRRPTGPEPGAGRPRAPRRLRAGRPQQSPLQGDGVFLFSVKYHLSPLGELVPPPHPPEELR